MPTAPVAHAEDLADFVDASPSSYHAAAEVARRLQQAGFATLLGAHARAARSGRRLRFTGADERTTRLLREIQKRGLTVGRLEDYV